MRNQGYGLHTFTACSVLLLIVCHSASTDAQQTPDRAHSATLEKQILDGKFVDNQEMARAFAQVEHALKRVQHRAVGDATLKHLAEAKTWDDGYPKSKGYSTGGRLGIGAPTDDQIEIPTKNDPMKVSGKIGVSVEYLGTKSTGMTLSGLYNGSVMWKTNNSHIFVTLGWFTRDSGAPDRLLTIVREEFEREGIRLIPMRKLDWPIVTTSERLSQLLSPTISPSVTSPLGGKEPTPVVSHPTEKIVGGRAKGFASPQEVVAAYRQALAKTDWHACVLCLTPASQGAVIRESLFLAGMSRDPKLINTIETHLRFKYFDDNEVAAMVGSKERKWFYKSLGEPPSGDGETVDNWLYQVFQKRVGDVPAFLTDCCLQSPEPIIADFGEIDGIRIEGDKASGYYTIRRPAPEPKDIEKHPAEYYLPRYFPWHFRRIGGSWLIAFTFGHDE
jgi:hypothetical protein